MAGSRPYMRAYDRPISPTITLLRRPFFHILFQVHASSIARMTYANCLGVQVNLFLHDVQIFFMVRCARLVIRSYEAVL